MVSPPTPVTAARVAILMGTKDGAAFLREQLDSIAAQTHANWSLVVSDDGSTDDTKKIVATFAAAHPGQVAWRDGPRRGVCVNFLALAADAGIIADYYAFCDQDDVWHPDKLARALAWLAAVPAEVPALYGGRTEIVTREGHAYGLSPLFGRPPSFRNALVQSLAGGNTMVFNRTAKLLVERAGVTDAVLHDWWLYQLVSGAGGETFYDAQPMLKYRQHPASLIGSNIGWQARLARIGLMMSGRFREWNAVNIAALSGVPAALLRPDSRRVIELFGKARTASLFGRLAYLRQSGVYRQTLLGNIALVVAAIIKRI
jgi:glycosyltransferase involved in cell wall biosynthesis